MSSTRKLPAKKRPIDGYDDGNSFVSDESSSVSSGSFQMDDDDDSSHDGGDDDEDLDVDEYEDAFKVKIMDTQDSNVTATPTLGTQPASRPAKKRKVSVSPRDSLAKMRTSQSPQSIAATDRNGREQDGTKPPLLRLPIPPRSKPNAAPPETSTSDVLVATPTEVTSTAASNPPRPKRNALQAEESEVENRLGTKATVVTPKDKTQETTSSGTKSDTSPAKADSKKSSKKSSKKKSSPAKSSPKAKKSPTKAGPKRTKSTPIPATPKAKAKKSPENESVVTANEAQDAATVATQQSLHSGKKKEAEEKNAATKAVTKSKLETAKKEKKKKSKKRSFQDELLIHIFFSCKPHTTKALAQHMKSNEASVNYCLLSLIDKGWVVRKEFTSKSRSRELFFAKQDCQNKELMKALETVPPHEVAETRIKLANLQRQEKSVAVQLHEVLQEPSNEDLAAKLNDAEREVSALQETVNETLERISAAKDPAVTKKQNGFGKPKVPKGKRKSSKAIQNEINRMRDEWKKRKEKCTDFVECLADGMEKKVKDVIKMLELETDEELGVKIPPKHVIKK